MEDDINRLRRKLDEVKKKLEITLKENSDLRKNIKQTYFDGYQQGRFDEKMDQLNS